LKRFHLSGERNARAGKWAGPGDTQRISRSERGLVRIGLAAGAAVTLSACQAGPEQGTVQKKPTPVALGLLASVYGDVTAVTHMDSPLPR
jgi:hypothetical protein